jgi:uncharacterized protein (UPF0254 family)
VHASENGREDGNKRFALSAAVAGNAEISASVTIPMIEGVPIKQGSISIEKGAEI